MPKIQPLNRLTAMTIQNLKEPGWYADGAGLYLEITASGRKRWALRVTYKQRTREFGLGTLDNVSLKQAREITADYRSKIRNGVDPTAGADESLVGASVPTLIHCAHEVHKLRTIQQTNAKHVKQWLTQLEQHIPAKIATKPVDQVETADVMAVLSPIWGTKPETARRIRQRLRIIMNWARVSGFRTGENPVDLVVVGHSLPKQKRSKKHFTALPYSEVKEFVDALRSGRADPMSKLAFEFLILTASRTSEVRFGRRTEIDLAGKIWTIPGEDVETGRRMKSGRDHAIPLTDRMIAIITEAYALVGQSALIFPDRETGSPMSENRFLVVRDALGYQSRCTPHGFRSSFRDWVSEETNFSPEVAEMALAHVIKSETEAAYRRGALLAKRRALMTAWERYVLHGEMADGIGATVS